MKRIPANKKSDYGISKFKTWFKWIKCDACDFEFRREPMWKIFICSDIKTFSNRFDHVCQNCVTSLENAINYRKNIINASKIPPPQPPSPGIKINSDQIQS